MSTVGEMVAVLRANTTQFSAAMAKSSAEVEALKTTSTGFSKMASNAFIGVGVAAAVGIAKATDATVAWAREVLTLQRVTGQTAESASALAASAAEFGVNSQQLTVGLGIFEKNIINGAKGVTKYGMELRDANGALLPFDEILGNVADKFVSLPKGAEQTAFAMNVFGRSGKSLIPILRQGADGLEELKAEAVKTGLVINDDMVAAAINLGHEQRRLTESFKGFTVQLGSYFLPVMTKVTEALTWITQHATIATPVIALAAAFAVLTGAAALTIRAGQGIAATWTKVFSMFGAGAVVEDAAVVSTTALTGTNEALAAAVTHLTAALTAQAAVTGAAEVEMIGYGATESGLILPTEALAAAQKDLAASTAAATAAASGGAVAVGFFGRLLAGAAALGRVGAAALGEFYLAYKLLGADTVPQGSSDQLDDLLNAATTYQGVLKRMRAGEQGVPDSTLAGMKTFADQARKDAVALGENVKVFDYAAKHAISYADALEHLAGKMTETTPSATSLLKAVRDMVDSAPDVETKLLDISGGADTAAAAFANTQTALAELTASSGQDFAAIGDSVLKALADPATKIGDLPDIVGAAIIQMGDQMQAWRDSIYQSFGGAGSALDSFADKSNVDLGKATENLTHYTAQIRTFGDNVATIQDRFGHKADEFINWAQQQGLAQQGLVAAVAEGSDRMARGFIEHYHTADAATKDLAQQISEALGKVFDKILLQLRNLARAFRGLPPIRVTADTSQAVAALQNLITKEHEAGISGGMTLDRAGFRQKGDGSRMGGFVGLGAVRRFAMGGRASGVDTIPALLQPGEFIMRKSAVDHFGVGLFHALNRGAVGGSSGAGLPRATAGASGGRSSFMVRLDRRHYDEQTLYQEDYGRGF